MYYVDLNSDLGESFGNYTIGMDREILKYVSSANVACGWHAREIPWSWQRLWPWPGNTKQRWARIRAFPTLWALAAGT